MPGNAGEALQDHPRTSRHFDAVCAAWRAASLFHSERITLILKRATVCSPLERPAARRRTHAQGDRL